MRRTKNRVIIVALVSVIVGLMLIWWSTELSIPWNAVIATFATIIITIGVVNLVSDLFLQKTLSDDLISLIQSDRRLVEAGLDGLIRVEDVDWLELIDSESRVECAVLDPDQFKSHIWPRMLDAAKARVEAIEVIIVDASSPEQTEIIATQMGIDSERYVGLVNGLQEQIEIEWKAMKSQSPSKCSLTVRRAPVVPRYGYIETSQMAALIIEPISRATGHVEAHVLTFRTRRRGHRYAAWLTNSLQALRGTYSAPVYSDARPLSDEGVI